MADLLRKTELRLVCFDMLLPLWELPNTDLVWAKGGIQGDKPPANPASGKVDEGFNRPDSVEIQPVGWSGTPDRRSLLVMTPDGFREIREVLVAEGLKVA